MKSFITKHIFYTTLAVLIVPVLLVWFVLVNHIGVVPWCSIYVQATFVGGDRGEIKESLKFLRKSNPEVYKTVCSYVDEIIEKPCILVSGQQSSLPPACYVRGTRIVYLAPQSHVQMSTQERARLIGKYAGFSQEFWEQ